MRKGSDWIAEYSESHLNSTNQWIHWLCVPAIMWSLLAGLWSLPYPNLIQLPNSFGLELNWAIIFIACSLVFYLSFDWKILTGMVLLSVAMLFICEFLTTNVNLALWKIALAVFVAAWVGQFIGHHIEGKKPSFFKDLQFLLVGPAWELDHLYRKIGFVK